jgi:hypothetical protein
MPSLDLAIALRVIRRCFHMRHATEPDELLEILGNELRAVVRDDPRLYIRVSLSCPLDDRLYIRLGHRLPDFPVHNETAAAIMQAAQVKERPGNIDVENVNVSMLVKFQRLLEAFTLE